LNHPLMLHPIYPGHVVVIIFNIDYLHLTNKIMFLGTPRTLFATLFSDIFILKSIVENDSETC